MLYLIRCNPVHPLNGALPGPYVPVQVTRCSGHISVDLYSASLQNLALLFLSQCPSGTIVSCKPRIRWRWTGVFQEQGQCFFIGRNCSIPTMVFYYFFVYLLSIYRLVLSGWGLRTDRVYIALSQPCTADLF